MNLVFFGASKLGYDICKLIIEEKLADIELILTIPKEFNISYSKNKVNNVLFTDFNYFNQKHGIQVITFNGNFKEYRKVIEYCSPDLILAVGWYYKIPNYIRNIAKLGIVGLHGSLLPKYRGGAPLVWAVLEGETESGVTLFYMDEGIDTGDIIGQEKFIIESDEYISDLLLKLNESSKSLIRTYLPKLDSGSVIPVKQDEKEATYFPQRTPEDGKIDWSWSSKKIKDFIRAQSKPYPGAFTIIEGKKITIWNADIEEL